MEMIGDRIRKRRKELRMTQGKLGQLSGLGTATISGLELGTQQGTTRLHEVAKALGVRVEWLTNGDGTMLVAEGVRDADLAKTYARKKFHDVPLSPDGAEIGAEWDKIEGDEYRELARDFIFGLVAAQKRAAVRPGGLTTSAKRRKNKGIGFDEPYPRRDG